MSTSQDRRRAIGLVSRQLRSSDDLELVANLLRCAAGEQVPGRSMSARQYDLLQAHRVLSLVPQGWKAPPDHSLVDDKRQLAAQQMKLVAEAHKVFECLTDAEVECRALKGLATSELDYPEPSQRTFGDLDVLVRPDDIGRAVASLTKNGVRRNPDQIGESEFRKGVELIADSGVEIDLHYRLTHTARPPVGLFDTGISVASRPYSALPPALRLVHAGAHLLLSPPGSRRLSSLADISAIRARHEVDLAEVSMLAQQMQCEGAVGCALVTERVIRELPVDKITWSGSMLEHVAYIRDNQNVPAQFLYQFSTLENTRERVRFVRLFVAPFLLDSVRRRGIVRILRRLPAQSRGGLPPDFEI